MKKVLACLLGALMITAGLAAGCAWHLEEDAPPPLSMFTDIPMPPDISVDEKNSQVYEHPIGRVGLIKATSRLKMEAVLAYYREAMPQNGWAKDSEFNNGDQHLLVYSKSPRSAAITVVEGWIKTDVEINVSAKK